MQTPLQKLKTKIEEQKEFYGTRFPQLMLWIDELMEYEEERFEDAFNEGMNNSDEYFIPIHGRSEPESTLYYSKTFKTN